MTAERIEKTCTALATTKVYNPMGLSEHGIFGVDTVYPMFEETYIMLLLEYPYDANLLI